MQTAHFKGSGRERLKMENDKAGVRYLQHQIQQCERQVNGVRGLPTKTAAAHFNNTNYKDCCPEDTQEENKMHFVQDSAFQLHRGRALRFVPEKGQDCERI
jgi:hypothetical protein